MNSIEKLKSCTSRHDLALILNAKPSILSFILYKASDSKKYQSFKIPKKNGGERTISAPNKMLCEIQSALSDILLNCIDDINNEKGIRNTLSHGFVRERSIITNAEMHKNSKNVLNIDLENFFGSFNFGRVRGFFIKNRNFELHPEVATTIAQIACYQNALPQGSPCSPVITNLITHSLDIILARMAKRFSCTYTRYADDISFSTRKSVFPEEIMAEDDGVYSSSQRLEREILRAGFTINNKKTRIQYQDSRQDVTGLIVNKKIGVKKEYRRMTKAMCHALFHTGVYTKLVEDKHLNGSVNELEGRLNFIDSVDRHNRVHYSEKLSSHYQHRKHGIRTREVWTSREKLLSRFLFYKIFYANDKPTVLCEGKTDNIYIKSAISALKKDFPKVANPNVSAGDTTSLVNFLEYNKRTRFILELAGGTSYLSNFIDSYKEKFEFYKAPKPNHPVIIILDNDDGLNDGGGVLAKLQQISSVTIYPKPPGKGDQKTKLKNAEFIHVGQNLYIILTPLHNGKDTMIENLFEPALWVTKIQNRTFDPTEKKEPKKDFYGKNDFATKVIQKNKATIKFDGFKPLLERMTKVIEHYQTN